MVCEMPSHALQTLTPEHLFVAHLIAERRTNAEIAQATKYSEDYVGTLRGDTLIRLKVREISDEIEAKRIQSVTDLGMFFNNAAIEAASGVLDLARSAEMENVRLGACKDILDRAPDAPKAVKYEPSASEKRIIQLGLAAVEGMKEALAETGRKDVVELIEGQDWMEGQFADNDGGSDIPGDGGLVVREV